MKIAFFSNYLSPHQVPFSDAMYKLIRDDYTFVSCEPYSQERINMGWCSYDKKIYELRPYESEDDYNRARVLARDCDVMIWGSASFEYIKIRVESKKVYFRYSERLLKQGLFKTFRNLDYFRHIRFNVMTRSPNAYLLSASAYAPFDFKLTFGHFKQKYKWGYYPKTESYNIETLLDNKRKNSVVSILWVGRLISLKHPEDAVELLSRLKRLGYSIKLDIIGSGELKMKLETMIVDLGLGSIVQMHGSMALKKVRTYMENANIFLITSDYNEGWGAVLNESMNSGCAVVCSDAIGASGFLIQDRVNGFLYRNGDISDLVDRVKTLVSDSKLRYEIGAKAYQSIVDLWSAEVAAERFVEMCKEQENGGRVYDCGPLSEAKVIRPPRIW